MSSTPTIQSTFSRHQDAIHKELRAAVVSVQPETDIFYGQMQYHLGWVDANLAAMRSNPGKYLRPTLLLLAYEAAGAWGLAEDDAASASYLQRALPAAAAIELTHNFTIIHDDIEDGDVERRHRRTLWAIWGIPQAINTGDGMFALSRLTLWKVLDRGVDSAIAVRLGELLDRTCLVLAEGQFLDISFEQSQDVSVTMYLDMIRRKTGLLIATAAEMGGLLGTRNSETIERLRLFGQAIGAAFQVRDDILGTWATTAELGKTPAGDIYRRKRSLPILHALEHASQQDQQRLRAIFQQSTVTAEQVEEVLAIYAHTETKAHCYEFLKQQCRLTYEALAAIPRTTSSVSARALDDMEKLVDFVAETAR